ncbi:expressed protein [Dictyostelium purpureum]|uniref:Expressed protein n=1 Tax=Dictyostelium purpureum TaxID=5786 RepID=F1A4W2_DICPU|nr:uncharacterized protein DICPUDRAFT_159743 [Dictyostelium purpureum]EGC28771.1 expressed protein [Dictyostelium purpureum]|eukprot:XP_003294706.1 expressed protein [Dictyostelium purpureum]
MTLFSALSNLSFNSSMKKSDSVVTSHSSNQATLIVFSDNQVSKKAPGKPP